MAKNTAAAAGTTAPAATAGGNATTTSTTSNSSTASAGVSVGGNIEPLVPSPEKEGSRKNGKHNTKRDETVPASPPPPPQCLLWTDTVLSTEGHPFLASFISAGKAAAAEAANADARAAAATETETTSATRGSVGAVHAAGGHKPRENNRSPLGSSDAERYPPASTLASAPATPATATVDTVEGLRARNINTLGRIMAILRDRRQQVSETMDFDFDPRQHYAHAVNRKGFEKQPRNAELDVMVTSAVTSFQFFFLLSVRL